MPRQFSNASYLGCSTLIVSGYLLTALPGLLLPAAGPAMSLIWLPTGVALAALIRCGTAYWPAVFVGSLIAGMTAGTSLLLSACIALINAATLWMIAKGLKRARFDADFSSQRDLALFALGVPLGLIVSASLGALLMIQFGHLPVNFWLHGWWYWWLPDVMGVVLITPLLLSVRASSLRLLAEQRMSVTIWLLMLALSVWLLFFSEHGIRDNSLALLVLPMPLVVWAALRLGVLGATAAVLALSLGAVTATALGEGPFVAADGLGKQTLIWAYMSTLALVGLMITTLQGERRSAQDELMQSEVLLQAIREAQARFIEDGSSRTAFSGLLATFVRITGSGYGFVAETAPGSHGSPALHTLAISEMDWEGMPAEEMQRIHDSGLVLDRPDSLFGAMVHERSLVVSSDPAQDPRSGGLPKGHPPLHNVMLMPLLSGGDLLGAVALANRPAGFDERLARSLEPLLATTASLIAAYRAERERERAEKRRSLLVEQLQKVTALVPGMVYEFRMSSRNSGSFPFASAGIGSIFDLTPEQVRHDAGPLWKRIHNEDQERVVRSVQQAYDTRQPWREEFRVQLPDQRLLWLQGQANPAREDDGSVIWLGYISDITEQRQSEEEQRIAAIAFDSQEGLIVTDAEARILRVNPAFTRITGFRMDEVLGKTPALLASGRHDDAYYRAMWDALGRQHFWQGEIWNRRSDGEVYPQWLAISAVPDSNGRITHYVASLSDITQRKHAEEQIRKLAFFDPLTSLPNRRLLRQHLEDALADFARGNHGGALLFIDLDHFKTLNDTRGHDIGDQLLSEVGLRLRHAVRDGDVVARLGGDEFVVLLEGLSMDPGEAGEQSMQVADKLREALCAPYQLGGQEYHSTPSIGISLLGSDDSSEDLLKRADLAMYEAKASGRNAVRLYNPAMQSAIDARAQMEMDLRRALPGDQFVPLLQAQVGADGRLLGAELLLHWRHPERGMVAPLTFIPLAEETGLIVPIGLWVIEYACDTLVRWRSDEVLRGVALAVNVSAGQFRQQDFAAQVTRIVERSGIDPRQLKLELTESLVLHDMNDAIAKMHQLRLLGIGFAMDDFGIGHSSLASLKQLPLDQLKIDQSFVRDLETDPNDAVIVQTIIGMAASMGLGVIAEGVETTAQLEFLRSNGCDAFQGYLLGRPVPREHFEEHSRDFRSVSVIEAIKPGSALMS